ncbi:hypothetical protein CSX11_06665 [Mycobacterium goodii]|nr:hypothetical protein CSX11_06665 [Mycolicibacterium goodii]
MLGAQMSAMSATIVLIALVALGAWRLDIRRHPNWATSADARFYISSGTWMVLIALYWFLQSRQDPHWVWTAWPVVAVTAALLLLRGLNRLDDWRADEFVQPPPKRDRAQHSKSNYLGPGARTP